MLLGSAWYNRAMEDEDDFEAEEPVEQPKSSLKGRADHLAPWQFKKGQSGNPLGRTPGKSMKEFAKEYLASLTDEERIDYFEGMNKADIWKMAEGNPANSTALTGKDGGPIQIEGVEISFKE
jgi:hypothetical protein